MGGREYHYCTYIILIFTSRVLDVLSHNSFYRIGYNVNPSLGLEQSQY